MSISISIGDRLVFIEKSLGLLLRIVSLFRYGLTPYAQLSLSIDHFKNSYHTRALQVDFPCRKKGPRGMHRAAIHHRERCAPFRID